MKSAREILQSKFGNDLASYTDGQEWVIDNILEAMEDYKNQNVTSLFQLTDDDGDNIGLVSTTDTEETRESWVEWCEIHCSQDVDDFVEWHNDKGRNPIERDFIVE